MTALLDSIDDHLAAAEDADTPEATNHHIAEARQLLAAMEVESA